MMIPTVRTPDTREETLDDVGRYAKAVLVGLGMVHAGERVEAAEFIVSEMFVSTDVSFAAEVRPDHS